MGMEVGRQAGPTGQSQRAPGEDPPKVGPQNGTGRPEGEEASILGGRALSQLRRANPSPKLVVLASRRLHLCGPSWERGTLGETPGRPREARAGGRSFALDLRVSLELQQFQLLGHEALHRCRGHGRRPARAQSRWRSGCARRRSRPDPVRRRTRLAPLPLPLSAEAAGKMAAAVAARALPVTFGRLASACSRSVLRASGPEPVRPPPRVNGGAGHTGRPATWVCV